MSFVCCKTLQEPNPFSNEYFLIIIAEKKMGIEFEFLPMEPGKPPENAFDGSNGFIKSLMPKWPPIGKHPPAIPFFFFDFDDSLRFRVWIPSFFIVNGRFTYQTKREKEHVSYGNCVFYESWARSRIYFHSGLLLCRLAFFAAFFYRVQFHLSCHHFGLYYICLFRWRMTFCSTQLSDNCRQQQKQRRPKYSL